ncbi:MAG: 3D domain-containing protein [Myxococcota bacterium]
MAFVLGACAADQSRPAAAEATPSAVPSGTDAVVPASPSEPGAVLGDFQWTYYWVAEESSYDGPATTSLYATEGCRPLAKVSADFARAITLEGTGRLTEGQLLNVSGRCSCPRSPCFLVADEQHPWGYGVRGRALRPFRSVAVDRNVIEYGTRLYIEALDGVRVPAMPTSPEFVHDGCVTAEDTGNAINGQHLDFFAATKASYRALDASLGLTQVTVREGGTQCDVASP